MYIVTKDIIVFNDRTRIDDAMLSDGCTGIYHRICHHDSTLANLHIRSDLG